MLRGGRMSEPDPGRPGAMARGVGGGACQRVGYYCFWGRGIARILLLEGGSLLFLGLPLGADGLAHRNGVEFALLCVKIYLRY